jgi:TrwC relaxase
MHYTRDSGALAVTTRSSSDDGQKIFSYLGANNSKSELVYVACSARCCDALLSELYSMLTISKALSARQAQSYHSREFASEQQNYWSRERQAYSEWRGALAAEWGLNGAVRSEHFACLSEGQHPEIAVQLVKYQPSKTYENEYGKEITSAEHRAGWDATFSSPKSVSLTALVGGDDRVRDAHRESVRSALNELERYAGVDPKIETGE